jgi:hypothetical protein
MLKSAILNCYAQHDANRICQGDILRDFSFRLVADDDQVVETQYPFVVIISQDCDLEQDYTNDQEIRGGGTCSRNQFLPNILVLPAFLALDVKEGQHLQKHFKIAQERINSERWKPVKQNKNERYHYLPAFLDYQVPELIIDFKAYYAIPREVLVRNHKKFYLATVNELFRESLSQRFSFYLSRVALPELAPSGT